MADVEITHLLKRETKWVEIPPDALQILYWRKNMNIVQAMAKANMVVSCSEARRCVIQRAVKVNGKTIDDILAEVKAGDTLQLGKREAIRVKETGG
jgi:tyrosyl-tRNA synthetase